MKTLCSPSFGGSSSGFFLSSFSSGCSCGVFSSWRGGIVLGGVLFLIGIRLLRVLCRLLDGREVFLGRLLRLADALAHAALRAGWTARVRLQRHFLLRLVRRETFLEPLENVFAAV